MNHLYTRGEAIMTILAGVGTLALAPVAKLPSPTIKTGVHPYPRDNGLVNGIEYFTQAFNHKPYYYAAWTDPNMPHENALRDWRNRDILSVAERSNSHLTVNVEVWPKDWETKKTGYELMWEGGPTQAGPGADEYMMNIARHLQRWTSHTGQIVPVRLMHEFNNFHWTYPTRFNTFFKRWVTILGGGEVDRKLKAIGQPALRTKKRSPANHRLRFIFSPLIKRDEVMSATELEKWWPGRGWVDLVGPDIYPQPDKTERARQFRNLGMVANFARSKGRKLCIPEFNWPGTPSSDGPEPVKEFLDWLLDHRSLVEFICQFECWKEHTVGLPSNPHPALLNLYREYYSKAAFQGG